jgi:general secretion pathway protein A
LLDSTPHHTGPDLLVDIDLAKLQGAGSVVDGMSSQLANLGAEQQGDRIQRLERSMLRLERVNIEILVMLQKLVASFKR